MGRLIQYDSETRPGLFKRLLAFAVTLALALGALVLVANHDKWNIDAIRRYFTYWSLSRSGEETESFIYDSDSANRYASLGNGLLVCTPVSIRAYGADGTPYVEKAVSLSNPVVSSVGNTALVYDVGGQELFVFSDDPNPFSLSLPAGSTLLSASLTASRWLVVTSQESGHRGTVTVYNSSFAPVIQLNLSSFVMDAALSPNHHSVAIVTMGLNEAGSFESRVNFYRLDRKKDEVEPDASCSVGNNVGLNLRWDEDGVWLLGENSLFILQENGSITGSYNYAGRYLKSFTLDGSGYAVLLLGKYRVGSTAELVVVDQTGNAVTSGALADQVLSLSAAGKYLAVLTAGKLTLYTQDLQVYDILEYTQGAQQVIVRSDGSALLLGASSARLYLPD